MRAPRRSLGESGKCRAWPVLPPHTAQQRSTSLSRGSWLMARCVLRKHARERRPKLAPRIARIPVGQ
eukprot:1190448-Alexandrium_andersonii.AAC.1